ncbi:MAG: hypothetical protein QCI38_05875 [Candidatus Thermoplasmatota archaeon]|nr:hypothetical protein [Candidatus Thermoplasmatota archaeon]
MITKEAILDHAETNKAYSSPHPYIPKKYATTGTTIQPIMCTRCTPTIGGRRPKHMHIAAKPAITNNDKCCLFAEAPLPLLI